MGEQYVLGPAHGRQLLALSVLLKDGELYFRGYDDGSAANARRLITDIGEEIALQIGDGSQMEDH